MPSIVERAIERVFEPVGSKAFSWFSYRFPGLAGKIKPNTASHVMTWLVMAWTLVVWAVYLFVTNSSWVLADAVFCTVFLVGTILAFSYTGFYTIQTWSEYATVVFGKTSEGEMCEDANYLDETEDELDD